MLLAKVSAVAVLLPLFVNAAPTPGLASQLQAMKDKVSKLTSSLGSGAKTALADAGKAAVVIGTDIDYIFNEVRAISGSLPSNRPAPVAVQISGPIGVGAYVPYVEPATRPRSGAVSGRPAPDAATPAAVGNAAADTPAPAVGDVWIPKTRPIEQIEVFYDAPSAEEVVVQVIPDAPDLVIATIPDAPAMSDSVPDAPAFEAEISKILAIPDRVVSAATIAAGDALNSGDLLSQIKGGKSLNPAGNRVLTPIAASQQMGADEALKAKLARMRAVIDIEEQAIDADEQKLQDDEWA